MKFGMVPLDEFSMCCISAFEPEDDAVLRVDELDAELEAADAFGPGVC